MSIDIVIPVRVGASNEHLRYALRSFEAHLPHHRVWIVGARLPWLRGVGHIPTVQTGTKYANTTAAMRAAVANADVSDPFLWCNDDFFVMTPVGAVPAYHRGPVLAVEADYERRYGRGRYLSGMRQTRLLLGRLGHAAPLSYELHVPMLIDKTVMGAVLDIADAERVVAVHKRTLYGNLARVGGQRLRDPKVLTRGPRFPRDAVFLSTMPASFRHGLVGKFIRDQFPRPSRYEFPGVRRRAA